MLQYPNFDPVAIHITDTIQVRWYGLMYIFAFVTAWLLLRWRTKDMELWRDKDVLSDLLFFSAIGVLLGGRLGYTLFYNLPATLNDPFLIVKLWQGGMSFHGGLIGVVIAVWIFAKKYQLSFLHVGDVIVPVIPLGLAFGRLGNFINGELWGRVTDVPWGMVFPHAGPLPRHPSQLYAIALEGFLLFLVVWLYARKPRKTGNVSGVFLLGYAIIRIFEEFFRVPDPQYGYLAFGWLTMGHILCIPMILVGIYFFIYQPKNSYEGHL